jgi:N-acetylmuramoyl-L-alanine amidase
MIIHLVAGHDNVRDPGAVSNHPILKTLKESELNIEFRNLLSLELEKLGVIHTKDNDSLPLRTVIADLTKTVKKEDLLIDIHFNAGPPTATGTEVIIKGNPNKFEREIAGNLAELMLKNLR